MTTDLLKAFEQIDKLEAELEAVKAERDEWKGKYYRIAGEQETHEGRIADQCDRAEKAETELEAVKAELDKLCQRLEFTQAEADVLSGRSCKEEQDSGDGPCGSCVRCLRADLEAVKAERDAAIAERDRLQCIIAFLRTAIQLDIQERKELYRSFDSNREELESVLRSLDNMDANQPEVVRVSIHDGTIPGCKKGRPCADGALETLYQSHIDDIDATGDDIRIIRLPRKETL